MGQMPSTPGSCSDLQTLPVWVHLGLVYTFSLSPVTYPVTSRSESSCRGTDCTHPPWKPLPGPG